MNGITSFGKPQFERLEARRDIEFNSREKVLDLRLRRSISWLGRAEDELYRYEQHDGAFIFYWIAFNSTYAEENAGVYESTEKQTFNRYFRKILGVDTKRSIYNALWGRFSGEVRLFLENKYVYERFWRHHNGVAGFENWEYRLAGDIYRVRRDLGDPDSAIVVLRALFDRMYVLRNQIFHGGATYEGSVNRTQVGDGVRIMAFLVPIFIELMMNNPTLDWGNPCYPPV